MKQLSGLDASFLNMETSTTFGHVSSLAIYGRPDIPDFDPYATFRSQLEARLGDLDPFRRRLVEVPFGLDRPYWINDPDFDIDFHIRHIAVPGEGTASQVGDLVGRLIGRPMDRSRPLWEAYIIEGLSTGDFAVLTKLHHSTIDGAAGAEMLAMILDPLDDVASDDSEGTNSSWRAERVPSAGELMARTAVELARTPAKSIRLQLRLLTEVGRVTRARGVDDIANRVRRGLPGPVGVLTSRLIGSEPRVDDDQPPLLPTMGGPVTPFNASITPHRRFAYRSAPLAHIKALKTAAGATVNDIVMAVCTGALRRYLLDLDALPDENLIAMVPVSIRTGDETEKWSNRVSSIFTEIPTTVEEPLERVAAMHHAMVAGKGQFDLMPADMIIELAELAPPALAVRAARLATRTHLADRTSPPANLVVSNVPGPRQPLSLQGGGVLKHYYPVSTIVEGQGLNITVQSYVDWLDFGLVACRELVPDLWKLMDYIIDEIDVLADALGITLPEDTVGELQRAEPPAAKIAANGAEPASDKARTTKSGKPKTKAKAKPKSKAAKPKKAKKSK